MVINLKNFLSLPVYTESGIKLGKVFDLEIDIENQSITQYFVRLNFFSIKYFLIQNTQVKEVKDDRLIVYDGVIKDSLTKTSLGPVLEE